MSPNRDKSQISCGEVDRSNNGGEEEEGDGGAWPRAYEVQEELKLLFPILWPIVITGFLLFSRSLVSMFFLGRLGRMELAGGALAIAFANITGYSTLKGLSTGMEPICGQAYGAKRWGVLAKTFQRTFLLLLLTTIPISLLWINMEPILLMLGQDSEITKVANFYIVYSLPDLIAQALLHPLSIFLRTQGITRPFTVAAAFAFALNVPINYILVSYMGWGVRGVALASAWNTFNINLGLICYLCFSNKTVLKPWEGLSLKCFRGWGPLVKLAIPSAAAVCLEWWWYELMMLLCGLLPDAKANVAAMGIVIQTTGVMYVLPSSLSQGLSTRVSNELGAFQPDRARRAATVGLGLSWVCGIAAFLFTCAVRNIWGTVFTSDERILALTATALPIVGFSEVGNCLQTTGCGVLRGSARPKTGANINFSSFYLIGLPVAVVTGFCVNFGFVGLWLGLVAAQASCAILMMYAVQATDWMAEAERAEELTSSPKGDLESLLIEGKSFAG